MPEAEPPPAGTPVRVDLPGQPDLRQTLIWMCMGVGVVALALMLMDIAIAPPGQSEAWVAAGMAAVAWTCWFFLRTGRLAPEPVAALVVLGVLGTATFSVLSFGSVRTAVNFLFVGAVVGAGIFLGRRALAITLLVTVALLAVLVWAESAGALRPVASFDVGLRIWVTQAAALAVVGLMVMHSRTTTQRALDRMRAELERRRQSEQERDVSLARFANIFRASPSPMLAQSARTGSILDVNPAFERCYGYRRSQVLGRHDSFLWADPMDRERYVERLLAERHIEGHRVRGKRADGSTFDLLLSSELGDEREDRLIISTVSDLSAHNDTLARLQRSEALFAKAFNFSPLNLNITRLSDGTFIEVNRAKDTVQGRLPEEFKGRTSVEMGVWASTAERQRFVDQLQRDGHVYAYDTKMLHKDGTLVDTRLWAEIIDVDGEPCILSCTVNISDEKRRENLLMEVAKGVAAETGEAFFEALSQRLASAVGAELVVLAERIEDPWLQTLAVWRDGRAARNFRFDVSGTPCADTLLQTGLMTCTEGLTERYPNAPQLRAQGFQSYLGQALRDAQGSPIGLIVAMWREPVEVRSDMQALISIFASRANAELMRLQRDREIAQLNETLEQRVRERTAALQKLNAELDAFAYSVSHDLKSPLRAIDGFTQLLQESLAGKLDADEQQLFERVLASTRRMGSLINDLLSLARVSQGVLQRERVDISELARSVLELEVSRHAGRRIRYTLEPGMVADCDPHLARIVLENLIGNAVKYSQQRVETVVALRQVGASADGSARFEVQDNGVGFDMAHVDQLFKPFRRLHSGSDFEGTGIGLATVRRIIERHGGSIQAEARSGEGARFTFDFGLSAPE